MIAVLYSENSDIHVTQNELTWFSSGCFMSPISALLIGLLTQLIGSRMVLLITTFVYIISWLLFYYATNSAMLLCAQALVTLTFQVSFVPASTYIAEISQNHLRNTFMSTCNLFILVGSFFTVLLASLMDIRTIILINLSFPIIGFVAIYLIPESPQWLANKDRFTEAEHALSWLRGWTKPNNVKFELNTLKKASISLNSTHNSEAESGCNDKTKKKFRDIFKPFQERRFYVPLASNCFMFIVHSFTGTFILITYTIVLFDMMNSPIDNHIATVIFDALRIFGAIFVVAVIHYTDKRKLLFMSLMSAGIIYIIISIILYLYKQNKLSSDGYLWIPTILMFALTFLTSGGLDKVVYIFNVELMPLKYRNLGAGLGLFVSSIGKTVLNKIFLNMIDAITLEGVYLVFASACIFGLVVFYFIIPETKGKTLKEIEDYYAGINNSESQKIENKIV